MLFTSQIQSMKLGYYLTFHSIGDQVSGNCVEMKEIRAVMKNYTILGQLTPETKPAS